MLLQNFTSVFEVLIGALSALVLFESLQDFFLKQYEMIYQTFYNNIQKNDSEIESLYKTFEETISSEQINRIDIEKSREIRDDLALIKRDFKKISKERCSTLLHPKQEKKFIKTLIINISGFYILYYILILIICGFEDSEINKNGFIYGMLIFFLILSTIHFYYYFTKSKNILDSPSKETIRNISLKFTLERFAYLLLFSIILSGVVDAFFSKYLVFSKSIVPYTIFWISVFLVIIPSFVFYYRHNNYLKNKKVPIVVNRQHEIMGRLSVVRSEIAKLLM